MRQGLRPALFVSAIALCLAAAVPRPALAQEGGGEAPRVIDAFAYDPDARIEPKPGDSPATIAANNAREAVKKGRDKLGEHKTIEISGLVAVQVTRPGELLGEGHQNCRTLRLAFDGLAFGDAVPYRCSHDLVIYNLALIDRAEEPAWDNLLRKRRGVYAYATISLTDAAGDLLPTDATDRRIHLYNLLYGVFALVGMVGVLWGFLRLARRSNMLRDSGKKRASDEPLRPFSLARSQTAWWFLLVLISFIFISLIDGSLAAIPNTVLGLMGIAGGTFLGSELVDSGRRRESAPSPVAARGSTGFFKDVFSDAGGVAFHRFQMFVWTIALGAIFVIRVVRNLEMPEFDPSILGLMGISNGTYLGMKIPETPKAEGIDAGGDAGGE